MRGGGPRKPTTLMLKQATSLFPSDAAEKRRFMDALLLGESREQAIIVLEPRPEIGAFPRERRMVWQPEFIERLRSDFRPARHPLYEKGAFYSLDASSALAASTMLAIPTPPKRILDLCASPGGKSVFAWRAFRPELLVANEIIRKRHPSLIANLDRCHITGSRVTAADPGVWGRRFPETFDLVLADAPCSGQSMLAKGDDAQGCFHPNMIDMNVGRQRRILGNAFQTCRPGGYILYTTCTYSHKENERVIEWLFKEYEGEVTPVERPEMAEFRSKYADFPCYRLFPHQGLGAGMFSCLLRKAGEIPEDPASLEGLPGAWVYGRAPESA
ncbi:hypothetical protein BH11ARM2_BH11ARM2_15740 [soil metagenome]